MAGAELVLEARVKLSRTLTAVSRKGELRNLPKAVAELSRQKLVHHIAKFVGEIGSKSLDHA